MDNTSLQRALSLALLASLLLPTLPIQFPDAAAIAPAWGESDVPTWATGDEWTYDVTSNSSSQTVSLELTYRVEGIEDVLVGGETCECYALDLSGPMTSNAGLYTVTGNVSGTLWMRRSDLAIVKSETRTNGTAIFLFLPGTYVAFQNSSYDPPLEEYDFPLTAQDTWSETSTEEYQTAEYANVAGLFDFNNTGEGTSPANFSAEFPGVREVIVPAGTFASNLIRLTSPNGTVERYYSRDARNIVSEERREDGVTTVMTLTAYKLSSQPVELSVKLSPTTAGKGQVVDVTGSAVYASTIVPVANSQVQLSFPDATGQWNATTDDNGYFTAKVAAPPDSDDTPTLHDIGSHGLVAHVKGPGIYEGYGVATLTVLDRSPPDLSVTRDDLSLQSSPLEGAEICATIRIRNTGLGDASSVDVAARLDGAVVKNWTLDKVRGGDRADLVVKFLAAAGNHSLAVSADPNNTIVESDETNNDAVRNFTVGMRDVSATGISATPSSPNEGDTVVINVTISSTGSPLSENLGIELLAGATTIFSGEVPPPESDSSVNVSVNWTAAPGAVKLLVRLDPANKIIEASELNNEASMIISVNALPKASFNITSFGNATFRFNASASRDPDGTIVSYTWTFGDGVAGAGVVVEHVYATHGDFPVTLNLSDDHGATAEARSVVPLPNAPPVAAAPSKLNITQGEQVLLEGSGADRDGSVVLFEWDFDGYGTYDWSSNLSGTAAHTYNRTGVFNSLFRVTDNEGAMASARCIVTVNPPQPVKPTVPPQPAGTTVESSSSLAAALSIITLIVLLAMAYFLSVRMSRIESMIEHIAERVPATRHSGEATMPPVAKKVLKRPPPPPSQGDALKIEKGDDDLGPVDD